MAHIPKVGLDLRCQPDVQEVGIDDAEMGDYAYDYVALLKEINLQTMDNGSGENPGTEPWQAAPPPIIGEPVRRYRNGTAGNPRVYEMGNLAPDGTAP